MGNPFTSLGIPEGYSAGHTLTTGTGSVETYYDPTYYDPTISYDPLVNPLTGEIDLSAGTWTITSPITYTSPSPYIPFTTTTTPGWASMPTTIPIYFPTVSSWPEGIDPVAGSIKFDEETKVMKVYDGKDWITIKNRTNEVPDEVNASGVPMSELDKIMKEIYG